VRILLDTCAFLWVTTGARDLSARARSLFRDPGNEVYLSAVSAWEIAVKHQLGRLELSDPPEEFVPRARADHGILPLDLSEETVLWISRLPPLHRDPFDRMLVCQALASGLTILTPDRQIAAYPVRTAW
jgi:PIN domain nuclease of toxin-antitoxin system